MSRARRKGSEFCCETEILRCIVEGCGEVFGNETYAEGFGSCHCECSKAWEMMIEKVMRIEILNTRSKELEHETGERNAFGL